MGYTLRMKYIPALILSLALLPALAQAQTAQTLLKNIPLFLNTKVIPFLLGLAFLFFVINVIRYFVVGGHTDDAQEKARALALYGVFAFVIIIVFWGVVNLLASSIGLNGGKAPVSDYVDMSTGGKNSDETTGDNKPLNIVPPAYNADTQSSPSSGGSSGGPSSYSWSGSSYDYSSNQNSDSDKSPKKPTINGSSDGSSAGQAGTKLSFSLYSTDPEKDDIYYQIAWSDYSGAVSPNDSNAALDYPTESSEVPSGTQLTVSRIWATPGVYTFQVRAVDTNDNQSKWATHTVTISAPNSGSSASVQSFDPTTGLIIQ